MRTSYITSAEGHVDAKSNTDEDDAVDGYFLKFLPPFTSAALIFCLPDSRTSRRGRRASNRLPLINLLFLFSVNDHQTFSPLTHSHSVFLFLTTIPCLYLWKLLEHLLTGLFAFATKEQATRACSGRSGRVGRRLWTGACSVCASQRRGMSPFLRFFPSSSY
jgi:hypothetical protein